MKRLLVTGANGYLGQHLVTCLRADSHRITTIAREDVDLAGPFAVRHLEPLGAFEAVLHLAARIQISLTGHPVSSQAFPPVPGPVIRGSLYRDNVLATANVLDYCVKTGVKQLFFASTLAVTGWGKGPLESYAHSKLAAEQLLELGARGYPDMTITVLRLPGIFGAGRQGGAIWNMCRDAIVKRIVRVDVPYPLPYMAMHMADVVAAFRCSLAAPPSQRNFVVRQVSDGQASSLTAWAEAIAKEVPGCELLVTGVPQPEMSVHPNVPKWAARARGEQVSQLLEEVRRSILQQ